jgi:DNA invertase Pin-like site-specific DNA recombinase
MITNEIDFRRAEKMGSYIAYYRLSKKKHSGAQYGIEVQKKDVSQYLEHNSGSLIASYEEIESATGRRHRPVLEEALRQCKEQNACLLIAKLDRLTRSVHFLTSLQKSGAEFRACDFPDASPLMLHIMVAFAEHEALQIRTRVKKGLERARARGVVLGAPPAKLEEARKASLDIRSAMSDLYLLRLGDEVEKIKKHSRKDLTYQEITDRLNRTDYPSPRGGKVYPALVHRAMVSR